MKLKLVIALSVGSSLAALELERAFAEQPPVDVRALDDEDEDFFNEKPAKKAEENKKKADIDTGEDEVKPAKKTKGGSDEEGLFEELDAMEKGVKIKRSKRQGENENTNQQVVNVIVHGEKDTKSIAGAKTTSENDASNEAKQLQKQQEEQKLITQPQILPYGQTPPGQKARTTRETLPSATLSRPTPGIAGQKGHTWSDWWNRENHLETGDVLFFWQAGAYGKVFNQGLGIEGLFSDWTGLRLTVNGSFVDRAHGGFDRDGDWNSPDESGRAFGFFNGASASSNNGVLSAFTHLEDLSMTFHFGHQSHGLDLFPSFGFAHYGYNLRTDLGNEKGGAGFLKVGVGLNWFYKRFFIGGELGWYPVELFRYTLDRNDRGADQAMFHDVGHAVDSHRVRFTAHVGMNF
jgi:hypothetical protein